MYIVVSPETQKEEINIKILKYICLLFKYDALKKAVVKNILMIFANERVQQCHPIITDMSVDYKE